MALNAGGVGKVIGSVCLLNVSFTVQPTVNVRECMGKSPQISERDFILLFHILILKCLECCLQKNSS